MYKNKKLASYNLPVDLLEQLDSIPKTELPNKSVLVENLLREWLESYNTSKGDGDTMEEDSFTLSWKDD